MAKNNDELSRIFTGSDLAMLSVAAIIVKNAEDNLAELTAENPNWDKTYVGNLEKSVSAAFQQYVGSDNLKAQRQATIIVLQVQKEILPVLSTIKLRLGLAVTNEVRRTEILKELGFAEFWPESSKKSVPDLVSLLFTFKENLTPALRDEITQNKNLKTKDIDTVLATVDKLNQDNITQKSFKVSTKQLTAAEVKALNNIYEQVVKKFSKYVYDFYKKTKSDKKELFSYSGIKKRTFPPTPRKPKDGDTDSNGGNGNPPIKDPSKGN